MLKTELRNPRTTHIDRMTTTEMMAVMQEENEHAAASVRAELATIGAAVDAIAAKMREGGRLFYVGCGTSGRLGVLDAAECPPTYGVPHGLVVGLIAGGDSALRRAAEGAEDSFESGEADLAAHAPTEKDTVIGISVAGGAAYVLGAFAEAARCGALRIALSSNVGTPIEQEADIAIHPDTGEEVITGSTRMKAGSAHKMILNMISTAVMIKLGHVAENLMINLRPTNKKLRERMIGIVSELSGATRETAEAALLENGFEIRAAVDAIKKEEC